MTAPLKYRELIDARDGLLVTQTRKGFFQIRHHSGFPLVGNKAIRSRVKVMELFEKFLPRLDWTQPAEKFGDRERGKVQDLLDEYEKHAVKMPQED